MRWARDGRDWPNRGTSRFVDARPHRWHIQDAGSGPTLLLLHGAGAATHSWRDLSPLLSARRRVVAIDLPGHGFTQLGARGRSGLDAIAEDVMTLLAQEQIAPAAVIGHSAGAAIGARLLIERPGPALIAINGAFEKFSGLAGALFPLAAKLLAANPLSGPMLATLAAAPGGVRRMLASTGGAEIDARGRALYQRLIADPGHVAATLAMMAQWDLTRLLEDLPRLRAPTLLITGGRDGAVPPSVSESAARRIPDAALTRLPELGHLAHEQRPDLVAEAVARFLDETTQAA